MKHATTGQLLDIKDGLLTPVSDHVKNCEICKEALNELNQIQKSLSYCAFDVPQNMWPGVSSQLKSVTLKGNSSGLTKAICTMAASVIITGCLIAYLMINQTEKNSENYQSVVNLMLQSNALESAISQQLRTYQVTEANSLRTEEFARWRLMLIDSEIQLSDHSDLKNQAKLWQNRVHALQDLSENMSVSKNTEHTGEI